MKKSVLTSLILAGALVGAPAVGLAANESFLAGAYAGAGIGWSALEQDLETNEDIDESSFAYKLYAGWNINEFFGAEVGYVDFGEADGNDASFEADGFTVAGLVGWSITPRIRPFAKVGYLWWDAETSVAGVSAGEDGSDVFFGLGTGFALTETFDLRLEYELYQLDDADAHSIFLSAQTSF
jgi:OOP family OmpA-OmpF porin